MLAGPGPHGAVRYLGPHWLRERQSLQSDARGGPMLTLFGACAVTFMMLMYALEGRDPRFVLAFAVGCALSSSYGFLAGTCPFGVVEAIWSLIAVRRYLTLRSNAKPPRGAQRTRSPSTQGGRGRWLLDARGVDRLP